MAMTLGSVTGLEVEDVTFPAVVKAPSSSATFFLGGAGIRGLQSEGNFIKFTVIGFYLQDNAIPFLSHKWNALSASQLTQSLQFFRDIIVGPFEKFIKVTVMIPMTGKQYSEKVSENCMEIWKSLGIYTDAEGRAIEKFVSVFKDQTFPPGSSMLFTFSHKGSLAITFSQDHSIPRVAAIVIQNKQLSEAVLETVLGNDSISPQLKHSLASRLSHFFKQN
uniref:Chalcone-flavonone isomerase family protein n=2 Tax=Cajanus cajan TaxID=3821 RepID=A0A151RX16_CAJCA|nr:Chalcone--flavonone isomerase [Cajanus cajan]